MEQKFQIKAEAIEKVVNGYNSVWHYDYQDYIFNDNYLYAYGIRIPQGCFGIKAMLLNNTRGIVAEYTEVELINGEEKTIIFDMVHQIEEALRVEVRKLTEENQTLRGELAETRMKLKAITEIARVA